MTVFPSKDTNVSREFEKVCPVDKFLKLKADVPVILCQTLSRNLCNGRMGIVKEFRNDKISVVFGTRVHEITRVQFSFNEF